MPCSVQCLSYKSIMSCSAQNGREKENCIDRGDSCSSSIEPVKWTRIQQLYTEACDFDVQTVDFSGIKLFLPAATKLWPRLCFYSCL